MAIDIFPILSIILINVTAFLIIILSVVFSMSKKLRILYFKTDNYAEWKNAEEIDKKVIFEDKEFEISGVTPVIIRSWFTNRKMFVLHHAHKNPLRIDTIGLKKDSIKPDTMKNITDMAVLKTFIQKRNRSDMMVYIAFIVALVIGSLVTAILFYSGLLSI